MFDGLVMLTIFGIIFLMLGWHVGTGRRGAR